MRLLRTFLAFIAFVTYVLACFAIGGNAALRTAVQAILFYFAATAFPIESFVRNDSKLTDNRSCQL